MLASSLKWWKRLPRPDKSKFKSIFFEVSSLSSEPDSDLLSRMLSPVSESMIVFSVIK